MSTLFWLFWLPHRNPLHFRTSGRQAWRTSVNANHVAPCAIASETITGLLEALMSSKTEREVVFNELMSALQALCPFQFKSVWEFKSILTNPTGNYSWEMSGGMVLGAMDIVLPIVLPTNFYFLDCLTVILQFCTNRLYFSWGVNICTEIREVTCCSCCEWSLQKMGGIWEE